MNSFDALQLPATVGRAVARLGYTKPTPIQSQAIPIALAGKDLIGCAQTGTGKTAAYCIPIFNHFLDDPNGLALVLVPTRELAQQIEDFWNELTHGNKAMGTVSLIGGMAINPQIRNLKRNPRLVIATPGRLIDHLERRTINLEGTTILVLDEADRMLDMGFEPQLARIAKFVPRQRQTLLFSATMPPEAERIAAKFVHNATRVSIGTVSRAAEMVNQNVVMTEPPKKNEALLDEINRWQKDSILVFARTKSRTDRVFKFLNTYGLSVARIHGDRSQGQRNAALSDFRSGKARILVATDIASRGIDVASVGFVINYDLPQVPEDYVHRIGRTGRAGASGECVSLVTREDRSQWRDIVNLLKKTGSAIPQARAGSEKMMTLEAPKQQPHQGPRPLGGQHQKRRKPHRGKSWHQRGSVA
jgi:ATP-dependent RNA helicase RhlE